MTDRMQEKQKGSIFFRGVLRTSRGSVILVAVENMPITPTGALMVITGAAYDQTAKPQEGGAGVGQSTYIGQQHDAAPTVSTTVAVYREKR